jgi:hypothetical protein
MIAFSLSRFSVTFLTTAALVAASSAFAEPANCGDIAKDVASAIQKDPAKVLMIVEDALVINEGCACEIVKSAIGAASADATLVNQIVQTGISVAPKMSGVIMDCATAAAPNATIQNKEEKKTEEAVTTETTTSGKEVADLTASGKDSKNPQPAVQPEADMPAPLPTVRPFLLQAPSGGFIPRRNPPPVVSPSQLVPVYP